MYNSFLKAACALKAAYLPVWCEMKLKKPFFEDGLDAIPFVLLEFFPPGVDTNNSNNDPDSNATEVQSPPPTTPSSASYGGSFTIFSNYDGSVPFHHHSGRAERSHHSY